jgi:hypothetical protein
MVAMTRCYRSAALLSLPLAALFAIAAAGAIGMPQVYAREVPLWASQGRGQDWVDLVFAAPLLAVFAVMTLRGSRVASLLLAGTLAYSLYSLVLYAFFVHFGPLFLVYAAGLGLSFYALATLASALGHDDVGAWFSGRAPVLIVGGYSVLLGVLFYGLWLREVIPALLSGRMPQSTVEVGLITNPVHVLDLGVVLPAFIVGGIALARRRAVGYWLTSAMLAFGVVMDVALLGMVLSMRADGLTVPGPPAPIFAGMAVVSAAMLALLLRDVSSAVPGRSRV